MASKNMNINLAVVQMDCLTGNIPANLEKINRFAEVAGSLDIDLVIFPECAATGYFITDKLEQIAEPANGPTNQALAAMAARNRLHMAVGTVLAEDGCYYDCQTLFGPQGQHIETYRKAHLFSVERQFYQAGNTPTVVDTPLGQIGMTVCYDMIFADYFRKLATMGAEIIINSTDWIGDAYQRQTWGWSGITTRGMAATRALENGVVVAMSNRVGHESGFDAHGHSCIAGPAGQILASIDHGEGIASARLAFSADDLEKWKTIATYPQDRRSDLY